jgi:hypothetical protein
MSGYCWRSEVTSLCKDFLVELRGIELRTSPLSFLIVWHLGRVVSPPCSSASGRFVNVVHDERIGLSRMSSGVIDQRIARAFLSTRSAS